MVNENIKLLCVDITLAQVDAIVNAANPTLLGGGGVDGAIHATAGPELLLACKNIPEVNGIRCPHGQARITTAGNLPAKYVIHTVGPIYKHSTDPENTLRSAYIHSLDLALKHQCNSIAFPAISCGIYGYPITEAAQIALEICSEKRYSTVEIYFYLFDKQTFDLWSKVATSLL